MINEGILHEEPAAKSKGGRIPSLLSLDSKACCTVCLDLSSEDKVRVSIINLHGESIAEELLSDMGSCIYADLLRHCHNAALRMIVSHGLSIDHLIGVSVAAPGILDLHRQILINSTYEKLERRPLAADLSQHFGLPCYVGNEANLMALATALEQGHRETAQDMIYLYIDDGLGIGIICNGKLIVGSHGFGGEISHWSLGGTRDYRCYCGHTGCLETELSKTGFITKLQEMKPAQTVIHWEDFVSLTRSGDVDALNVIAENGKLLGRLIAALNGLFDPRAYWLGGCIVDVYPQILPYIQETAAQEMAFAREMDTLIHCSENYEMLTLQGCAELAFANWYP